MDQIDQKQLLAEVDDLIRSAPQGPQGCFEASSRHDWLGHVSAALTRSGQDSSIVDSFLSAMSNRGSSAPREQAASYRRIIVYLHRVRRLLQWKTGMPTGVVIEPGMVFDYFDEIRKIIEQARHQIFFVDPYMDAEFVSRYMQFIDSGIEVRLLTKNSSADPLITATDLFTRQSGIGVEIRTSDRLHDRFIFVDRQNCYLSGASFKDGAKRSPTVITQITDAFDAQLNCYEKIWNSSPKRS